MNTKDLQQRLREFHETYRGIDDLGYSGLMFQAVEALERLERIVDVQRYEAARARAQVDNAVALLTGIHSLLYPAPITTPDGRTLVFRPKDPDPHEVLQELSDRIRALPEKLAGLQWLPIETAPAEQRVLVFEPGINGDGRAIAHSWNGQWFAGDIKDENEVWPTLWMPLPPKPEA